MSGTEPRFRKLLTPAEYSAGVEGAARLLWAIAAGILGDRTQAEDVVQEAALIGWQRRTNYTGHAPFAAWLGRIVRFVALNQLRKTRRRGTRTADPAVLDRRVAEADPGPAAVPLVGSDGQLSPDQDHFGDEMTAALRDLRPTVRACLLMKVVLELEYSEIAAALDIPPGTAMSHVHRARAALRQKLGDRVGRTPTGETRE